MADLTSFNPLKVLLWRDHLEGIAKGNFLPPVAVHIDMTQDCNFNCPHCSFRHRRAKKYMPSDHLMRLADFIKDWGVKAAYVAVSGESMLHPYWVPFIYRLKQNGIDIGVVTNGSIMDYEKRQALLECCRFAAISLDAPNEKVFARVHGVSGEMFSIVCNNVQALAALKGRLEVTIKYLILPKNCLFIYETAKLAKDMGVDSIHIRPAQPSRISSNNGAIQAQINRARELEDDSFAVHAVRLELLNTPPVNTFDKCRASLGAILAADGRVYICCGLLGEKRAVIGSHYPNPYQIMRFWGSQKHKQILEAIDPKECPRCPYTVHQHIIEKVIIKDGMFKNFL